MMLLYLISCCSVYYYLFLSLFVSVSWLGLVVLYSLKIGKKWSLLIFCFEWLVGAFSVFGNADTGNPVQI